MDRWPHISSREIIEKIVPSTHKKRFYYQAPSKRELKEGRFIGLKNEGGRFLDQQIKEAERKLKCRR